MKKPIKISLKIEKGWLGEISPSFTIINWTVPITGWGVMVAEGTGVGVIGDRVGVGCPGAVVAVGCPSLI